MPPRPDAAPAVASEAACLAARTRVVGAGVLVAPMVAPILLVLLVVLVGPAAVTAQESVAEGESAPGASEGGESRPTPPGPEGDDATRELIRDRLDAVGDLEAVDVMVHAGVVRLTGTVASARQRETALALAASAPGVVHVVDRLELAAAVGERLEPQLDRTRERLAAVVDALPLWGIALAIVLVAWLVAALVRRVPLPGRGGAPLLLRSILRQALAAAVVLAGVLVGLELVEATALVGAVLGMAGLAGIALGFAFRDIAENYLASILLATRQRFQMNDHVVIGEHEGKVVRLTTRDTVLMTLDGNHLRIPNAVVFKATILNYTTNPLRRFTFTLAVGDSEDLARVQAAALVALRAVPGVLVEQRAFSHVVEAGDWSVTLRFWGWVDQREVDVEKVRSEAIRLVREGLDAAGVVMPVPIQQVRIERPARQREERTSSSAPRAPRREARPSPGQTGAAAPAEPTPDADVGTDDVIERQIETDRRTTDEENLLDDRR